MRGITGRGVVLIFFLGLAGCSSSPSPTPSTVNTASLQTSPSAPPDPLALLPNPHTPAEKIVNGAKREAKRKVVYNASYKVLRYPNGDVPAGQGACTDVVIRAFRGAGIDLQQRVHEDMVRNFRLYPQHYGLHRPDPNIDHRRVPNLKVFFRRLGRTLPQGVSGGAAKSWQPGDVVCWKLDSGLDHCGVLSNERNADGLPLVIHNLGVATQEDCLTRWQITGHFRYP